MIWMILPSAGGAAARPVRRLGDIRLEVMDPIDQADGAPDRP
jgi:hypothetical protein